MPLWWHAGDHDIKTSFGKILFHLKLSIVFIINSNYRCGEHKSVFEANQSAQTKYTNEVFLQKEIGVS